MAADNMEGKVVLVSGGARGIGQAAALLMATQGARVAVADLDGTGATDTVSQIRGAGGQAIAITADVTRADQVQAMVAATVAEFGRLDCAFNNAGVAPAQVGATALTTAQWSEESFDRMIAINLKGVWLAMRAELEVMARQGFGTIVNTASVAGLLGLATSCAYVAAKHGVIGLTKTAAIEYAAIPIRVNAVCPGFIETDMTREVMARRGGQILGRTPMGRMGTAREVAELVCWLCSDRAGYVNGAAYNVDGGFVAS
ncbi:MAG: SDR family oxidoreductase [Burkholderiaceae bacterium]